MSWNLRTWGTHAVRADDCRRMAEVILKNQIDIACIQELQVGDNVFWQLNAPIAQSSLEVVQQLAAELNKQDGGGSNWQWTVSGCDSTKHGAMRDAYAFFWKAAPKGSKSAHKDPVDKIEALSEPQILDDVSGSFPGRRPAMFTINVYAGKAVTPLNLVSLHAMTPCNSFGKGGKGAGHSINSLANLEEIGGGMMRNKRVKYEYEAQINPLPETDTIVLGDFNYQLDPNDANCTNQNLPYKNLLTNYQACINDTSGKPVAFTTYSADPTKPFGSSSAYDNMFALKSHDKFKAAVTFTGQSGVYDFITEEVQWVAQQSGITYYAREAVWFTVFKDAYKGQHAKYGISDHLAVWAEFSVGAGSGSSDSQRVLPTSGLDNNCLFHAVFGAANNANWIVDGQAATHRTQFADWLTAFAATNAAPMNANVRRAVLSSMINVESNPVMRGTLQVLLGNNTNPFNVQFFFVAFANYVRSIRTGRMLYVHEAELLAYQANRRIVMNWRDNGQLATNTLNGTAGNEVQVFHQGVHFSRFNPNA